MSIENNKAWIRYRPGKDPYVAARVLETLPYIAGDRGRFIVGMFAYFRWVDDEVDERTDLTQQQKLKFIEREMILADGYLPPDSLPMEEIFDQLPWHIVPEGETRAIVKTLLGSIADDAVHQNWLVRSDEEISQYSLQMAGSVVNGLFLVLNGKTPEINPSLETLLDAYIRVGSLEGLGEDLRQGVIKVPLESKRAGKSTIEEVLTEYDEKKFNKMKRDNLYQILRNVGSFIHLNIPVWQKAVCMSYIFTDVLAKKPFLVKRKRALKNINLK